MMKSLKGLVMTALAIALVLSPTMASGAVLNVPSQFDSIQEAIDNASEGDTVLVDPGSYYERLYFGNASITVESVEGPNTTVIDAEWLGPVVTFDNGNKSTLRGFTLTHGDGSSSRFINGGGVISWAEPTVKGRS